MPTATTHDEGARKTLRALNLGQDEEAELEIMTRMIQRKHRTIYTAGRRKGGKKQERKTEKR